MVLCACRYFSDLVDAQIELAKSKGTYNKGVQFINEGVDLVKEQIIWQHPHANGGQV
jgi:hypothetical protein